LKVAAEAHSQKEEKRGCRHSGEWRNGNGHRAGTNVGDCTGASARSCKKFSPGANEEKYLRAGKKLREKYRGLGRERGNKQRVEPSSTRLEDSGCIGLSRKVEGRVVNWEGGHTKGRSDYGSESIRSKRSRPKPKKRGVGKKGPRS